MIVDSHEKWKVLGIVLACLAVVVMGAILFIMYGVE